MDRLNALLLDLGFKFTELFDPAFRNSLNLDDDARIREKINDELRRTNACVVDLAVRRKQLDEVRCRLYAMHGEPNRQTAGRALERILNELFAIFGLHPNPPFRVDGEEIDGSFDLDNETYLVEAKWERDPLSEAPLLVFRGKIEGKSAFTRGVFIALNGVSDAAQRAITQGKQPVFFLVDGCDLDAVLSGGIELDTFLRLRMRLLAERGRVVVPYPELRKSKCESSSRAVGTVRK